MAQEMPEHQGPPEAAGTAASEGAPQPEGNLEPASGQEPGQSPEAGKDAPVDATHATAEGAKDAPADDRPVPDETVGKDPPADKPARAPESGAKEDDAQGNALLSLLHQEPGDEKDGDEEMWAVKEGEEETWEGKEAEEEPAEPKEAEEEPEKVKEAEEDAPADNRPRVATDAAKVSKTDSTINVLPTGDGKVLMAFSDSGFQHMVAAARCTVGVKAGRYAYEVRIIESYEVLMGKREPPKQSCCIGFSTAGSSLFLGDGVESIGFDSEGHLVSGGLWSEKRLYRRFVPQDALYTAVLNLDPASPNANTVSLFRDGIRLCQPQPLPESLVGKALYPTVNYKSMSLHVNFGPICYAPLPFTCRMLQDAAADDVVVSPEKLAAVDGKREVLFPVGLPDEGTFEWLDDFHKENPGYCELSPRAVVGWATKSGLYPQRGNWPGSNDRPSVEFGHRELDELWLLSTMRSMLPVLERDCVVMEVRGNLLAEERKKALQPFEGEPFRKVAVVVMGEPPDSFKEKAYKLALEERKKKVAADIRWKKAEEAKSNGKEEKEGEKVPGDKPEDEPETKAEEPKEDIEDLIRKAQAAVELTPEEKANWFPKLPMEDLTNKELSRCFSDFTVPDQAEGFDEVRYAWQPAPKVAAYLKDWIAERKLTQRVEDLQPGQRFRQQLEEWTQLLQEWRRRQDRREPVRRSQPSAKRRKVDEEEKVTQAKDADSKEKEGEAKKEDGVEAKGDAAGEAEDAMQVDGAEGAAGEKKEEDKQEKEKDAKLEADEKEITLQAVDPMTAEDVNDIGNGEPLYAQFTWEDWTMLSLRFELHLLVHSYRADVGDPERPSFTEAHLPFYYNKYYRKQFHARAFGGNSNVDVLELIKDTIEVLPKNAILEPQLSEDTPLENFVRLTEDHRRERLRRTDAGDEAAALQLQRPPPRGQHPPPPPQPYREGGQSHHAGGASRQPYRSDQRGGYPARGAATSTSSYGGHGGRGASDSRMTPIGQASRYTSGGDQGRSAHSASQGDSRTSRGAAVTSGRPESYSSRGASGRGSADTGYSRDGGGGGYTARDSGYSRSGGGSYGQRDGGVGSGGYQGRESGSYAARDGGYQRDNRGAPQSRPESYSSRGASGRGSADAGYSRDGGGGGYTARDSGYSRSGGGSYGQRDGGGYQGRDSGSYAAKEPASRSSGAGSGSGGYGGGYRR